MKAEEKEKLARFLDITGDSLRDGYRRSRGAYHFTDDGEGGAPGFLAPDSLEAVAAEIRRCAACALRNGRKEAVSGEGVDRPLVLAVGEAPGAEENVSGRPFVGKAGQLLDRMLAAIALSRGTNCFIANTVKCRPPDNRTPLPEEIAACAPFLERQISLLRPRVILALGRTAVQALLDTGAPLWSLRGRFAEYRGIGEPGIPLLPTYHPSVLLRDESKKRPAWEDLKVLRSRLLELDKDYEREAPSGKA